VTAPGDLAAKVAAFGATWGSGYLAEDIAPTLMCEPLNLLLALLPEDDHVRWLREHNDCDDPASHGLTDDQMRDLTRPNEGQ